MSTKLLLAPSLLTSYSTDGGNMLFFQHMQDFEMYSSNSKGAIQGYGYEFHKSLSNMERVDCGNKC